MGQRGPKPQPTAVLKVKGTGDITRMKRRAATEPELIPELLPPPAHLSKEGLELWREASQVLYDAKVIARGDYMTLYAYCESFVTWRDALDHVRTEGMVFTDHNGVPRVSPYHKICMDAQDRMVRCCVELGLTPSSRSKVSTIEPKDVTQEDDPWGQI